MELEIRNVTKRYRDKTAVADVSLTLTAGVWGLLGANGAGKTTLMRMITGILRPTTGQILCDGVEIGALGGAYREKLGYLPQEFGFYPEFTVQDYLEYMAALKGLPRAEAARQIDALLERVSLTEVRRKKIVKLSGGMKRRVGIAQALLNDPEIDAVSVCTPNKVHSTISIDFMRAGKDVLCEKPAARIYSEALEMQKVRRETGRLLNIGVCNRFNT